MEGEINNFIMVWSIAIATMCYSHTIGKLIPKGGGSRLIALFPAIVILLLVPLRLISALLGGPTSFFLAWLSTFKLILFAFDKGPLYSNPPLSLPNFILISCLPIQFQHNTNPPPKTQKSYVFFSMLLIIFATFIPLYQNKQHLNPHFLLLMYAIYMYIGLEFIFTIVSSFTQKLLHVQLVPQFNEPYLCTSLQDFWGKRWNVMVNRVLHPTVYDPVHTLSAHVVGRNWAPLPAILASFAVSGLMHEVVFYHIKRETRTWEAWEPSWDATCFFLIHGVCSVVEVTIKKSLKGKTAWHLPRLLSWFLTLFFVLYTAILLFLPALVRCRVFDKACTELNEVVKYVYSVSSFLRFPNVTTTHEMS